jgi:glycosyltransferase involved in cell wall biosynthesis
MPTYNRPAFVEVAIQYFLRQDYTRKELVIVDDGQDSVEHLVPADDQVHYLRTAGRGSIGSKRNLACELSTGELIAHWDDDDWYATSRLSRQVDALLAGEADIVGANQFLYWAPDSATAWRYAYPAGARPWLHDPTLCYSKTLWSAQPFPLANHALDCGWLWSGPPKRLQSLNADPLYVGIIHATNTSLKATHDARWTPASVADLARVVGTDMDRYLTGATR